MSRGVVTAMLGLWLGIATILPAARAADQPAPDTSALDAAVAAAQQQADPLALYDTIVGMQVLSGDVSPTAADAALAEHARPWVGRTPTPEELSAIMAEHRRAMERLLAVVAKAIETAQWPADKPAD